MPEEIQAPIHEYGESYFHSYNYADRAIGALSMYAFARRFYASLVRKYDGQTPRGRLLEMGSGLGHLLSLLEDEYETFGFDIAHYASKSTKKNSPRSGVLVASADQTGLFCDEAFSAIVALHLVEHLVNPSAAICDIQRILRPGGIFLFATPNPTYKMRRYKQRSSTLDAIDKDPTHINVQPPEVWAKWVEGAGMRVLKMGGDGLWDVPYLPIIPKPIQFALFGIPSLAQVLLRKVIIPVDRGVNLIVIAQKE